MPFRILRLALIEHIITKPLGEFRMSQTARSAVAVDERLPTEHDQQSANQLRQILASQMTDDGSDVRLTVLDSERKQSEVILGPLLSKLRIDLLRAVGSGNTMISVPLGKKMSTQEAADVLNVSRPHLVKLLEQGELKYSLVGRHRRIEAREVFDYQRKRDETRGDLMSEILSHDADYL